jgi:hypothetical protein
MLKLLTRNTARILSVSKPGQAIPDISIIRQQHVFAQSEIAKSHGIVTLYSHIRKSWNMYINVGARFIAPIGNDGWGEKRGWALLVSNQ